MKPPTHPGLLSWILLARTSWVAPPWPHACLCPYSHVGFSPTACFVSSGSWWPWMPSSVLALAPLLLSPRFLILRECQRLAPVHLSAFLGVKA